MIKKLILIGIFIFSSCKKESKTILIEQRQFYYPVLKGKDINPVLRIDVIKADSLELSNLSEIIISTAGTSNLSTIESISLYYNKLNDSILTKESELLTSVTEISDHTSLKVDVDLKYRTNYFWVSYKLKDSTNINNLVSAECKKVITNYGETTAQRLDSPKKLRLGVAVRKHGDDAVETYRIPALVTTNKGTLLGAYDVRRQGGRDLQGDIDIGISRSTDKGVTWSPMAIALDRGEWANLPQKYNGISDANLLVNRTNNDVFVSALWMHGVINTEGKWLEGMTQDSTAWNHQWRNKGSQPGFGIKQTSQFLIAKSSDDGRTWEEPINITKMCKKEEWWLFAPAPGNGITLKDGTLVIPTQGRDKEGVPFSNITYSKDDGETWKTSEPAYTSTTECAIVQLEDGSLMLNMRDNRNREEKGEKNGRAIFTTDNLGETWKEHHTSHGTLPEPVCMASLYKHEYTENGQEKSLLLFSNPNMKEGRYNITIKTSLDNGETWPEKYWILIDEGRGRGYSSLTSVDEGTIGILYESSQADMTFQKVLLKDILNRP